MTDASRPPEEDYQMTTTPPRSRGVCPVCGTHHPFARLYCSPECRKLALNPTVHDNPSHALAITHPGRRHRAEELREEPDA